MLPLLTTPGQLRRFLLVSAQSAIGTAMGYVALLLLAHDQFDSPWSLAAILTATLLPSAFLGPYFGNLADRHSRRTLTIVAEIVRTAAFVGLALSGTFALTLALALVAGAGTALFIPASRAAVPTIAGDRSGEAIGVLVALTTGTGLLGSGLGAAILLVAPVQALLVINAATFALSAVVLSGITLDGPRQPIKAWVPMTLDQALAEERFRRRAIREGFAVARSVPRLQLVLLISAGATSTLALANVAEPLLVTGPLGGDDAAFALVVGVFGLGAAVGGLLGAASLRRLNAAVLFGAVVMGGIALAPTLEFAIVMFALGGVVEGLSLSCDQRLVTALTPERILGRTFGLKDSLDAVALLVAYGASAGIATAAGPRWVFGVSAATTAVVGIAATVATARAPKASPVQTGAVTTV